MDVLNTSPVLVPVDEAKILESIGEMSMYEFIDRCNEFSSDFDPEHLEIMKRFKMRFSMKPQQLEEMKLFLLKQLRVRGLNK